MTHISPTECRHEQVHFGSGDYYVFCLGCGARWGRLDPLGKRREYGVSMDGEEIGCDPSAANRGPAMGNSDVRANPAVTFEEAAKVCDVLGDAAFAYRARKSNAGMATMAMRPYTEAAAALRKAGGQK
jgi:hypothetical protein